MEHDFGSLWDLRRSPAIDGSNDTLTKELLGPSNFLKAMKYISEDKSVPDTINKAELGCILSHLVTIRRALSEGHNIAMIVEDDITPLLM
jgi:GR25 family glycosyltransferase involved in LPS biosynthesis